MKTPSQTMSNSFAMMPIVITSIRQERYPNSHIQGYLESARCENIEKEQRFLEKKTRYYLQLRSRRERLEVTPCFEAEERGFAFARLALDSLQLYLQSSQRGYLIEAYKNYEAAEYQFQQMIKIRKRLAASSQEELQRAA